MLARRPAFPAPRACCSPNLPWPRCRPTDRLQPLGTCCRRTPSWATAGRTSPSCCPAGGCAAGPTYQYCRAPGSPWLACWPLPWPAGDAPSERDPHLIGPPTLRAGRTTRSKTGGTPTSSARLLPSRRRSSSSPHCRCVMCAHCDPGLPLSCTRAVVGCMQRAHMITGMTKCCPAGVTLGAFYHRTPRCAGKPPAGALDTDAPTHSRCAAVAVAQPA